MPNRNEMGDAAAHQMARHSGRAILHAMVRQRVLSSDEARIAPTSKASEVVPVDENAIVPLLSSPDR